MSIGAQPVHPDYAGAGGAGGFDLNGGQRYIGHEQFPWIGGQAALPGKAAWLVKPSHVVQAIARYTDDDFHASDLRILSRCLDFTPDGC